MPSYKTPGVYVEEISKLPASIAPVATAIPAFIGYTENLPLKDGEAAANHPVRIQSMLEYVQAFGGPYDEKFKVSLADNGDNPLPLITVKEDPTDGISGFILYYQLQLYFANGGGPCYVVSVDTYLDNSDNLNTIDGAKLKDGVTACEQEDEITLLVVPEAMAVGDSARADIYNIAMLAQCARLQDRFAIMDVATDPEDTVYNDGLNFRNKHVGADNLKYGAAYYPALRASIPYAYAKSDINIDATGVTSPGINIFDGKLLSNIETGKDANGDEISAPATAVIEIKGHAKLENDILKVDGTDIAITNAVSVAGDDISAATELTSLISGAGFPASQLNDPDTGDPTAKISIESSQSGSQGNTSTIEYLIGGTVTDPGIVIVQPFSGGASGPNMTLFNAIKKALDGKKPLLYPCGAIAGVYARVDRDRGVWKAPANVSLNGFSAPSVLVTPEEQENLNVDPASGKSINAIRLFNGKGILVWGARSLAGNDNEWRYVPVRRLYIFVEESVKKATEFVVFEPNDAKTWSRVKAMITNFLTGLWREGALAGAAPSDAFFVKVGLGETMTADDILNGIMNIEIGMAAVRPAEFIVLKFSHKLQES